MSFLRTLGLLALGARQVLGDCVSFGMDFQNGGSYFQNSLSSENFTFVSQFEGCQNDTAYNILVDPNGDQTECSDTNLQPDDTNQLANCPIEKNQLYSGSWSVLVLSNNGDSGAPIAYERDFALSVGPQLTTTYIPTVTATVVSTPVINVTSTEIDTCTTTLAPITVTSAKKTINPTKTITPHRVTTTSTKTLFTLSFTEYSLDIVPVTKTATATCFKPHRPSKHDPIARIRPTVGPLAHKFSAKFARDYSINDKVAYVKERAERLAGRAPDPQPLTITDTNTADWVTSTWTSTASPTTATFKVTVLTTVTATPAPITVLKGTTIAPAVTVTASTRTRTVTRRVIATSVTTKPIRRTYTIVTKTTPAAVASACKSAGGIIR